jgi:hypothetical protein
MPTGPKGGLSYVWVKQYESKLIQYILNKLREMLDKLLPEIQEIIFDDVPFCIARGINKNYQRLATKIEWKNLTPIIVTKEFMENYLNKIPKEITFSITNGSDLVMTKKFVHTGGNKYRREWYTSYLSTPTVQTIKEEILTTEWDYFNDDNIKPMGQVFVPHYDIIDNFINQFKHPLIKADKNYRIQKLILTIQNYYQKLQSCPFQASSFLDWIALSLKISPNGSDDKKMAFICNKIRDLNKNS